MDVLRAMREATDFTPSEQQLAQTILALGARLQGQSIKELAGMASVSIALSLIHISEPTRPY